MLEIVAIFFCCKSLGDMLRRKGRKPLVFQILLVLSWFGGEILAAMVYTIALMVINGGEPPEFDFTIYFVSLLGAACGAGFWFLIAWMLPALDVPQSTRHLNPLPDHLRAPTYGSPPNFGPPTDPKNPYAPPRSRG